MPPQPSVNEVSAADGKKNLIAMTVITKKDILKCIGCDLTDILEQSGVQVRRSHSVFYRSSDTDRAYVSLRGASDTQVILLVDGVRQEENRLSRPLWDFIPVHHIERIEIVKGPQSSRYGDSAIGGVVHIITKKADCSSGSFCAEAKMDLSTEAETGQTFYLSGHTRGERSGIRVSLQGDWSTSQEYPEFLSIRKTDPEFSSHYRERALNLNFDHRSEDGQWLIEGSSSVYNSRDEKEPRPLHFSQADSTFMSLGTTYYLSPDLMFKSLSGYDIDKQVYNEETEYTSRRISLRLFGEYHFDFLEAEGDYILTAGGEGKRERVNSDLDALYDETKRNTRALFASLEGDHDPFFYQVAVRGDNLSGDINEKVFTWRGDASYRVGKIKLHDVYLRGGVGTGFRAPGFDEQNIKDREGEKLDWELENSQTHEVGLRIGKDPWNFFDIGAFKTELEHQYIEEDFDFGLRPDGKYGVILIPTIHDNAASMKGIEIQSKLRVGPWDGNLFYTYTDTDKTKDLKAHNPVRHQASLTADYSVSPKLTLGAKVTHRGKREDHEDRFGDGDSVNLWDLQGFYRLNNSMFLGVAVENVTDKKYDQYSRTEGPRRSLWFTFEIIRD